MSAGSGEQPAPPNPEPTEGEPAPVELVIDPKHSDTSHVIEVQKHLRKKFELDTNVQRRNVVVQAIGPEKDGGDDR